MASNKPQIPVEVPATGVRKDINEMLRTPDMAAAGDNCLYFDGTIRPRPALSAEIGTPTTVPDPPPDDDPGGTPQPDEPTPPDPPLIPEFELLYNSLSDAVEIDAACITDDAVLIISLDDNTWRMSIDAGQTWTEPAFDHPGAELTHLEHQNGFLFGFTVDALWRAPIDGVPTSFTWTEIITGLAAVTRYVQIVYDDDNDAFLIFTAGSGAAYWPDIWAIYDASASATKESLLSATLIGNSFSKWQYGGLVNKEWFVFGARSGANQILITTALSWVTDEYVLGDSPINREFVICSDSSYAVKNVNLLDVPAKVFARLGQGILDSPTGNRAIFQCSKTDSLMAICSVDMDDNGFVANSFRIESNDIPTNTALLYDYQYSDRRILYAVANGSYAMPSVFVSANNGVDWMRWDRGQNLGTYHQNWFFSANNALDHHMMFADIWADPDRHGDLWKIPTGGDPETTDDGISDGMGDVTTLFQLDLSDEDNALIVGGTRGISRLNRTTGAWDRITADPSQEVGTTPWVDDNDIPPLSADPSDDGYESGVTIDGLYGANPWVFRATEGQGETFLLGTNGQCDPICYHPDMPGPFARRMGYVPPNDPNDLPLFDPLDFPDGYARVGNPPPQAKCIAVAANRVLLGNLPNGSPYGVEVSGFNDHDRGWGLEQFTLLGDTPGEIVTMNEISALSVAMYKTDAIYHAIAQTEFLGVAAPFRFELAKSGISGPCSAASVLRNFDGRHIYLARDGGVYMYDSVAPLDGGRNIRRMIQDKINYNELGKVWGMVDTQRKLVWFFYPAEGSLVNQGIVISTDQGYPWPVWPIKLPRGWNFTTGGSVLLTDDINIGDVGRLGDYGEETLASFSTGERTMLMGLKDNAWLKQKWGDDGGYTDNGIPLPIDLETGWMTPGGIQINTADELYHIFSSPDPEMELEVRLKAQQVGQNIRYSNWSKLSAGKLRRRTRSRVSGIQFAMQMRGKINRIFNWGGGAMTIVKTSKR